MPRTEKSKYIHGSKKSEQRRLSLLNDLLNKACLREIDLRGGEVVLDVGSGLGQFSRAMAEVVRPRGRVIGIERDPNQIAEALRQAKNVREDQIVKWRQGEATALPLQKNEWGKFDVVHTRFVLEHIPNPRIVVREMVKAARLGGRIILADDDHEVMRLWPEPAGFAELWQVYMRAYEHLGCDPNVGRRLVALLHGAGARPVRNDWVFFGSCAGAKEFPAFADNLIGVIETARAIMTGPLGMRTASFNKRIETLRAWANQPDAAIWYPLCWAEGRKI